MGSKEGSSKKKEKETHILDNNLSTAEDNITEVDYF